MLDVARTAQAPVQVSRAKSALRRRFLPGGVTPPFGAERCPLLDPLLAAQHMPIGASWYETVGCQEATDWRGEGCNGSPTLWYETRARLGPEPCWVGTVRNGQSRGLDE